MKLSFPILLTFTSLMLSFSLKGAKGIEEALFTWTDSPSTTLNVIWLVKDKDPTLFLWGQRMIKYQVSRGEKTFFLQGLGIGGLSGSTYRFESNTGYRIFLGDKEFRARTLPSKRPDRISFVTGGDMMHSPDFHKDGVKAMASRSPHFALLGGDLAYANGQSWERWLDWIEEYADHAVSEDGYSIPFMCGDWKP